MRKEKTDMTKNELLETEVGGKTLRDWETDWEPLAGGFGEKHPELRTQVGLARALLAGDTMYILRAVELPRGGIEKGLQRIRGCEQTGNAGYGAQMIRKHINQVDLEIIVVGSDREAGELTKVLKTLMVKYHDPAWDRPHQMRLERLRAAKH